MHNIIVISRYQENLEWLDYIKIPYIIYNKGPEVEGVINIPNVGRESETMLRYIIENYENIPENVTFLQGDPFPHSHNIINQVNDYTESNRLIYLSDRNCTDNINGEPNHPGLPIKQFLIDLGLDSTDRLFEFAQGAHYIVPRSMIWNKTLSWWKNAYNVHNNQPLSPWITERVWPQIWNHTNI